MTRRSGMRARTAALWSAAACLSTATVSAQRTAPPRALAAGLTVYVRDSSGDAIDGAEVVIPALAVVARTDATGRGVLGPVRAGEYIVTARRFGFLADSQRVRLHTGAPTEVVFVLRTSAYVLDTALVESAALRDKMAAFDRRRASGRGTFITRDDIERRHPITLADVLRTVRGLTIRTADGRTELRFVRANARLDGPECPPEMWVDGVRAFGATVDEFHPGEVEGIELYRGLGQLPAEYLSRSAGCGLVIIWTRSPSRIDR